VRNPLIRGEDGAYRMDLQHIEECFHNGSRLLLLCSPHNPVGRAWTRQELRDVLALCERYGAVIVSDEIHADFVYPDRVHVPMLSLPGARERVILLCAASKTFNIAGLRQAALLAPDKGLRNKMKAQMQACGMIGGNLLSFVATRAAYERGDDWLDGLTAYLAAGRDMAAAFLAEQLPHIGVSPLEATYLMWLDCRAVSESDGELRRRTRQIARVALSAGDFFGPEGSGFLRLNIGCPHAQLREGLRRLEAALKSET
jgi:cystathionine beta-lyase